MDSTMSNSPERDSPDPINLNDVDIKIEEHDIPSSILEDHQLNDQSLPDNNPKNDILYISLNETPIFPGGEKIDCDIEKIEHFTNVSACLHCFYKDAFVRAFPYPGIKIIDNVKNEFIKVLICKYCGYRHSAVNVFKRHIIESHNIKMSFDFHLEVYKHFSTGNCLHCVYLKKFAKGFASKGIKDEFDEFIEVFKCKECSYEGFQENIMNEHIEKHRRKKVQIADKKKVLRNKSQKS